MIQQMDVSVLLWIQENLRFDFLTPFWKAVTFLGDSGWFWIALGIGLLLFKRTRKVGMTVLTALIIGALITNVTLKNLVARTRPYVYTTAIQSLLPPQSDFSFPSGHTCASFAAAWVCWKLLPTLSYGEKGGCSGKIGKVFGAGALVLAGLIAFSRMYLGVHYPTDILGGLIVGLTAGWLALRLYRYFVKNGMA